MSAGTYGIVDGNGDSLGEGITEQRIWAIAQRKADDRGEPVYVYEMVDNAEQVEVRPSQMIPTTSIHETASRAEVMAWASTCNVGDYLATYDETEADDDPTSECGYGSELLADCERALRTRGLTLRADDCGLVVAVTDGAGS
jgi:hypothetical protein